MEKNTLGVQSKVGNSLVTIGRFTYGYEKMAVWQFGEGASLAIGSFCSIAESLTVFLGGNHRIDWITTFPFGHIYREELGGEGIKGHPATKGSIVIGNDVWIGSRSTIMSGVTVGDGAVIAATSTVVKDVKPYEIVGGNPARHLKYRFPQQIIELLIKLAWWNLPVEEIKTIIPVLSQAPDERNLRSLCERFQRDSLISRS